MNDNIEIAKDHIMHAIMQHAKTLYGKKLVDMLNSGVMSIDEFIDEMIMELIRYAYDKKMPRESIRKFLSDDGAKDDDALRMAYGRTMDYVQKYRDREAEQYESFIGSHPEALDGLSMDTMKDRLSGYKITKMNYFEMTRLQDLRILKSMVEHRLDNVNSVDNKKFRELFEEYETFVDGLEIKDEMSNEDVVFNSIAFWVLEWKYPFELFYRIALYMEEKDLKEIERSQIVRLAGLCGINRPYGKASSYSRFIKIRDDFVPKLVYSIDEETEENQFNNFTIEEYIFIKCQIIENYCANIDEMRYLKDWFAEETTVENWAEFLREYNVFSVRQEKFWSNKHIRMVRQLIQKSTL